MNPITHNEMRPKPGFIFSHNILFFFIPVTKTLVYVLTSSASCIHCWHFCQLNPYRASQPSQNLAEDMAFLPTCLLFLISFRVFFILALLLLTYCITFWHLNDSLSIPLFTPAPPSSFLLIMSSHWKLVITKPCCCHMSLPALTLLGAIALSAFVTNVAK